MMQSCLTMWLAYRTTCCRPLSTGHLKLACVKFTEAGSKSHHKSPTTLLCLATCGHSIPKQAVKTFCHPGSLNVWPGQLQQCHLLLPDLICLTAPFWLSWVQVGAQQMPLLLLVTAASALGLATTITGAMAFQDKVSDPANIACNAWQGLRASVVDDAELVGFDCQQQMCTWLYCSPNSSCATACCC